MGGSRADDLSDTVKLVMLLGQYMQDHYHGRYYAKAQNLARTLMKAYLTSKAAWSNLRISIGASAFGHYAVERL